MGGVSEGGGARGTLQRAFHLATGAAVAEYPNKIGKDIDAGAAWGIAEEMTLGRLKRGRGEAGASPWQVLREAHAGDDEARPLWQEYALTMTGRRQQVWSNGLKRAIGLLEIEDEQAAEGEEYTEDQDELLHRFDRSEWHRWRPWRAAILAAARRGPEAVAALLRDGPGGVDMAVIEDDEPAPPSMPRPSMSSDGLAALASVRVSPEPPGEDFEGQLDWWALVLDGAEIEHGRET